MEYDLKQVRHLKATRAADAEVQRQDGLKEQGEGEAGGRLEGSAISWPWSVH